MNTVDELRELTYELKKDNDIAEIVERIRFLLSIVDFSKQELKEILWNEIKADYDMSKCGLVNALPTREWIQECDRVQKYKEEVFEKAYERK